MAGPVGVRIHARYDAAMRPFDSAGFLLIATGALLGLTFPFGKIAAAAGVSPFVWSFLIAAGSAAVLAMATLATGGRLPWPNAHRARYFTLTAFISYALPNLLVFSAIPKLGAGFTGIMFTLSPVFTLALSIVARLKRPNALGLAGLAVGFLGALIVTLTRGEVGRPADPLWIAVGLMIPLCLALGNIYRTLDWPEGAGPIELAIGSNVMAAIILFVASLVFSANFPIGALAAVPLTTLAQVVASSGMYALFFRLQSVGGPVYLSQMGYVAAAIGLAAGVLFLNESYAALTWAGALVIVVGVVMTTLAQRSS